ncbi:MAG: recombinase family protein, partial [Hungatella sp.]
MGNEQIQSINDCASIIRVAIYIRVSSDEQAKFGDSIRDQKESGLSYIASHKNTVLQDVYIDDGISGQKLERGDFKKLLDNAAAGLIDLIIFTKLDRWFRSLRHYLNTQATLESHNVSWLAVDQPYFDTSTPYGRAFVAQSMTWAELEAQNDGIRIKDVFKNKISHGEVVSGKVPRGYKIVDKHLVLTDEAPIILDIFNYAWSSQSLSKTIRYMEKEYNIVMNINNLRPSILQNVKYTGRFRGNENFCPRIIPDDLFNNVQSWLIRNQNVKSSQKYNYIFSGLLFCDECGYHMSGCHINVLAKRTSGKEYRYKYPAYECKQYRSYR